MGEIEIFRRAGLVPVFFSRTLAGPRMPSPARVRARLAAL
jgi:hypothetical protein